MHLLQLSLFSICTYYYIISKRIGLWFCGFHLLKKIVHILQLLLPCIDLHQCGVSHDIQWESFSLCLFEKLFSFFELECSAQGVHLQINFSHFSFHKRTTVTSTSALTVASIITGTSPSTISPFNLKWRIKWIKRY